MPFLPIAQRELRIASRKSATWRLRWIFAGVTLITWLVLLTTSRSSMPAAEKGKMLFIAIGVLALAFSLFAGVFQTSDCLSEEKREGTLGLLFLTPLNGYDVVLGKLMVTSLHAFYGLLAILPVLSLPLLIGGVTVGEFWRIALALVVTLLFSLSLGMVVSAFSRDSRQAFVRTLLILICSAALPFGIARLPLWFGSAPWNFLLWPSPVWLYTQSFDTYYRFSRGAQNFLVSELIITGMALLALGVAGAWLRNSLQEKSTDRSAGRKSGLRRRWRYVLASSRRGLRWIESNPFLWLCGRDRRPFQIAGWLMSLLFLVWLGFLMGLFSSRTTANDCFGVCMFLAFGMHQILKILIALEASRRLNEDRRSSALELLLVTPQQVSRVLAGQTGALQKGFAFPAAILIVMNLIFLWTIALFNPLKMGGDSRAIFCEIYLGGAFMLLVDASAITRVAMWLGVRKRRHHLAVLGTLARIVLPPWLAFFFFVFVMSGARGVSESDMMFFIGLWFAGGFVLAVTMASHASLQLKQQLRETAAQAEGSTKVPVFEGSLLLRTNKGHA